MRPGAPCELCSKLVPLEIVEVESSVGAYCVAADLRRQTRFNDVASVIFTNMVGPAKIALPL